MRGGNPTFHGETGATTAEPDGLAQRKIRCRALAVIWQSFDAVVFALASLYLPKRRPPVIFDRLRQHKYTD